MIPNRAARKGSAAARPAVPRRTGAARPATRNQRPAALQTGAGPALRVQPLELSQGLGGLPQQAPFGGFVRRSFSPADERLAAAWHAILLGCLRKSMALMDRPAAQPVRRLRYFETLLREVERERFPVAYWQHLTFNFARCEEHWQRKPDVAPGRAWPRMEQAKPPNTPADSVKVVAESKGQDEKMMTLSSRTSGHPLDGGANGTSS